MFFDLGSHPMQSSDPDKQAFEDSARDDAADDCGADKDRQFATSLARGLDVLRCFSAGQPALGNGEIADFTGLSKSTVSRLTYTLTQLGYLRRLPHTAKYELGAAVVTLAHPLVANIGIHRIAVPQMKELADHAHGWVSIGVRERTNIVYMETVSFDEPVPSKRDFGLTFPIVSSAIGHAYLAALPEADRAGLLNHIKLKTPKDWARYGGNVGDSLADYRNRGFCMRLGGYNPHVNTVAVPMRLHGEIVLFNCAVPVTSLGRGQLEFDIGPRLAELVRQVQAQIESAGEARNG